MALGEEVRRAEWLSAEEEEGFGAVVVDEGGDKAVGDGAMFGAGGVLGWAGPYCRSVGREGGERAGSLEVARRGLVEVSRGGAGAGGSRRGLWSRRGGRAKGRQPEAEGWLETKGWLCERDWDKAGK